MRGGVQRHARAATGRAPATSRSTPMNHCSVQRKITGVLRSPVVRVAVRELVVVEQVAAIAQVLGHRLVRVPDRHAAQPLGHGVVEGAVVAHRAVDLQPLAQAGRVVLGAVAGRGVHEPGAVLERHVVGGDDRARCGRRRDGGKRRPTRSRPSASASTSTVLAPPARVTRSTSSAASTVVVAVDAHEGVAEVARGRRWPGSPAASTASSSRS